MSSTVSTSSNLPTIARGLIKTMRPHQWTKNVLIFAAIVFDRQVFMPEALLRTLAGFAMLCLMASTIYLINDIVDVESDRKHPTKRFRPIPAGELPIPIATAASILIPLIVLPLSFLLSPGFTAVLVFYFVLHIAYSFRLKRIVVVDILAITGGFVLRVLAGVTLITVENFSPWLYVCSGMLSLFLAVGKRRQEYLELGDEAASVRSVFKDYSEGLLDEFLRLAVIGTFLTYVLYTIENRFYEVDGWLGYAGLLTIPFVLYALMRYLLLIYVRGQGSAPDEVLLTDRPLQLAIVLWGITFMGILYLPPVLGMV